MTVQEYASNLIGFGINSPQHKDWIKTKKSEVTGTEYQFNDIELIEDLMDYFFQWNYRIVDTKIVSDKVGFSVTVTVELLYWKKVTEQYAVYGIASEYAANTKQLTLITPKAASMAFKNAAKKIGKVFGKDLNRGIENNELPVVQVEKESKKTTKEKILEQIGKCTTADELETYKLLCMSDVELKNAYQEKLHSIIKKYKYNV
ncbi:MAG: hypothetical protein IM591_13935 [Chitinophagaceae bacterium]|jgi:hypothetical protein|uniref:hypothetical protein n=1 Tax=Microcystis sp. M061S2 TaxID=2771171 RepID=UPI002590426A|nr:hypothetical protein [Microcystis sp. M061S2]MCA2656616.1 hypothetical protein [Microcystis sp. M061S2]MCA6471477.1 hypothetical protein [Chitinophagaceae bacterium]